MSDVVPSLRKHRGLGIKEKLGHLKDATDLALTAPKYINPRRKNISNCNNKSESLICCRHTHYVYYFGQRNPSFPIGNVQEQSWFVVGQTREKSSPLHSARLSYSPLVCNRRCQEIQSWTNSKGEHISCCAQDDLSSFQKKSHKTTAT